MNNSIPQEKVRWVRRALLEMHGYAPETRIASSLSCVEILCALFYGAVLRFDARQPRWEGRDRFVMSKGHGSLALYAILADLGFFDTAECDKIGRKDGMLKVIPDPLIPGYETLNGSVGLGLGVACGMALALQRKRSSARVVVLCGDGELFAGACWEALMLAPRHALANLTLVVDRNKLCMMGPCTDVADLSPLHEKFAVLGWKTAIVDGHDIEAVRAALVGLMTAEGDQPRALICDTVKGKGVPELEHDALCHVRSLAPESVARLLEAWA